jgi:ribose 5-phosphate isomerase A
MAENTLRASASSDDLKKAAAEAAAALVEPGMSVGLGTGSTAEHFVAALGSRARLGLVLRACVATSERTEALARQYGLPVADLNDVRRLDLTVDGADECTGDLDLIKGAGGALLREKMVAAASARFVVIADDSKLVAALGRFSLPVEIVPFGWRVTAEKIAEAARACGCAENFTRLRGGDAHPARTDQGNYIADVAARHIPDPARLARALDCIPGVVEHGLFLGMAQLALIAGPAGVTTVTRKN